MLYKKIKIDKNSTGYTNLDDFLIGIGNKKYNLKCYVETEDGENSIEDIWIIKKGLFSWGTVKRFGKKSNHFTLQFRFVNFIYTKIKIKARSHNTRTIVHLSDKSINPPKDFNW